MEHNGGDWRSKSIAPMLKVSTTLDGFYFANCVLGVVFLRILKIKQMNTAQRKFLIERIQQKVKDRVEVLKKSLLQYPSASNYIFKAVLNEKLELQPKEVILYAIKKKALNAKEGENWLSEMRMGYEKEREIKLLIQQLIVLPDDYKEEMERVKKHNESIVAEIDLLKVQLDTIEVRVQLASDKALQNLVNEVDDMGSLSLIDTKLKLLS